MLMVKLVVAPGPSSPQPPTEPSAVKSHISASYFILFCFVLFYFLVFRDRVSLCSSGRPGTHPVDQADPEPRNPPAPACRALGTKVCATTPSLFTAFYMTFVCFPYMATYNFTGYFKTTGCDSILDLSQKAKKRLGWDSKSARI